VSAGFSDHFSGVARHYAAFRPRYPQALFDWLATLPAQRGLAWDCAAGSGQATVDLAARFERVIATDASAAQLESAPRLQNVEYRVASAEASGLEAACADLVTVAQALHWFDVPRFYAEAERVLVPGGVLAVWTYGPLHLLDAAADAVMQRCYRDTAGPYWPPEREHVENGYRTLPFPYPELAAPSFELEMSWTLEELAGYVASWSATARCRELTGRDAPSELRAAMREVWPDPERRLPVRWPLAIRAGRNTSRRA